MATALAGTISGIYGVDTGEEVVGGARINHIARGDSGWWAVDSEGQIYHDAEVVATIPDGVEPTCIQPTPETVWIGADRARLYGYENGVVEEDEFFTSAPGRDNWHTPWGGPPAVRSMTLDADHTLYVGVHVGGILRYDDTGPVPTIDISSDVHQVMAHPAQKGAVFAATARGVAVSHNGHDFAFRVEGLHATYCRAIAVLEDRFIVTASTGPRSNDARVYSGSLWEGELTPVGGGLLERFDDNVDTHCLSAVGDGVHLGHGDSVWRSGDAGETWEIVRSGLPKVTCVS